MVSIYLHVYLSIQKYNRYSGEYKGGHLEKLLPPVHGNHRSLKPIFFSSTIGLLCGMNIV